VLGAVSGNVRCSATLLWKLDPQPARVISPPDGRRG